MMTQNLDQQLVDVGIVVIGRNEGDRLMTCLRSVPPYVKSVVYVDSGSSDRSVERAEQLGVEVVILDAAIPFTAARARNTGFAHLRHSSPNCRFVQFVDGDCELREDWILNARVHLLANPACAIVAGELRERSPETSVFNKLCELEWAAQSGEARSVGGIAMARTDAFVEVDGFNTSMVAGEEPELCYRLRKANWKIHRLAKPMAYHEAEMLRFSQWWRRARRSGYAYAHELWLHREDGHGYRRKETNRIWVWTVAVPVMASVVAVVVGPIGLSLLALYPLQVLRISISARKRVRSLRVALAYASFDLIGKWAQLSGQLVFYYKSVLGHQHTLIEYK